MVVSVCAGVGGGWFDTEGFACKRTLNSLVDQQNLVQFSGLRRSTMIPPDRRGNKQKKFTRLAKGGVPGTMRTVEVETWAAEASGKGNLKEKKERYDRKFCKSKGLEVGRRGRDNPAIRNPVVWRVRHHREARLHHLVTASVIE